MVYNWLTLLFRVQGASLTDVPTLATGRWEELLKCSKDNLLAETLTNNIVRHSSKCLSQKFGKPAFTSRFLRGLVLKGAKKSSALDMSPHLSKPRATVISLYYKGVLRNMCVPPLKLSMRLYFGASSPPTKILLVSSLAAGNVSCKFPN
jgi:hypothetical protein